MKRLRIIMLSCVFFASLGIGDTVAGESELFAPISDHDRCPVCGMFIARYAEWVAQLRLSDGKVVMFDGPKDMLAYYFSPVEYGGKDAKVIDILVKDYYSQQLIDGRTALYVTGSDVYGPMGAEFIPFSSREAAESFLKDHHGTAILLFTEITPDTVQSMRKGHTMKGEMKH